MVRTGLSKLLADPPRYTRGGRVGLVGHAASVTSDGTHAVEAMLAHPEVILSALFGPQHGLTTHTQDNMIEWHGGRDRRTGLPLHSLYGEVRRPTAEMLAGVDVVLVDLQDVGTRVYTYLWTLCHVMQACAELSRRVVVLDRPNPIGGEVVAGPMLRPGFESFVGLYPIPLRHGLTIGELAELLNAEHGLGCDLEVVWMDGWRRRDWFDRTGLPWLPPSPNMPTLATATVYPGTVLVEGTQLSEGRGTTTPFEVVGAPGLDGHALAAELNAHDLPGVRFLPATFEPTFQKHAGRLCEGVRLLVTDRRRYPSILAAALLLTAARRQSAEVMAWLPPPYEYVHDRDPIAILAGSDDFRQGVESGRSPGDWLATWRHERAAFEQLRARWLRYD